MPRRRRRNVRSRQRQRASAREELERRAAGHLSDEPALAEEVVARRARREPFHRWHVLRQGFSPALVRRFLSEAGLPDGPVLDPFSGSGTVPTECARRGRPSVGVEALAALAFLTRARFLEAPPPWSDLSGGTDLATLAKRARHPSHLAAVLLAAAEGVDGEGRPRGGRPPPAEHVRERLAVMAEDAAAPLPAPALVVRGDARRLPLAAGSIAGVLTSPPYLSRYDYTRIAGPLERLLGGRGRRTGRRFQLCAFRAAAGGHRAAALHPAAAEAARSLAEAGERRAALMVRGYFEDMARVLGELARVLRPGAPAWIVVGGAHVRRTYVPSDLILADMARAPGLDIEHLRVARRLRASGRRLGTLLSVAPRETLIVLRRTGGR